jgi:hypothetical protein
LGCSHPLRFEVVEDATFQAGNLARFWLRRAELVAAHSGNRVNLADVKTVWAFWHQRFGSRKDLVKTLAGALLIFRGLRKFDCRQKERYMARKFLSVWPEVVKQADLASTSAMSAMPPTATETNRSGA